MSSYTPTTEEVRNDYLCSLSSTELAYGADGRWDRWLAEVKAQERQKVIDELEQGQIDAEMASRRPDDEPYVWGFRKAVAIAKGETDDWNTN